MTDSVHAPPRHRPRPGLVDQIIDVAMTAATARSSEHAIGGASTRPHFAGFEALRAVASLMVVVHHAASTVAGVGETPRTGILDRYAAVFDSGVAVFFVLSGFLLWWPIVDRSLSNCPREPMLRFWWRRILRIVPAYWLALTVLWSIGIVHLGSDAWRYYLFLQVYSKETILGGIVVAWSLCTEVAFYALVPVFAGIVDRLAGRHGIWRRIRIHLLFCAALWSVGVLSRAGVDQWWPSERGLAFTWLPQNLDLFGAGMALAVVSAASMRSEGWRTALDRWARRAWPWWLAAGALFSWYALRVGAADFATGYQGVFWQQRQLLLGVVSILLLVPVVFGVDHGGAIRRFTMLPAVVWIGSVSYGLYLWHLDIMREFVARNVVGLTDLLSRGSSADPAIIVLAAIGTGFGLALAAASWYGVERPLQRFRNLGRRVG